MIQKYKDFLSSKKINDGITPKERHLLKVYGIVECKFNPETNLIDVFQEIKIHNRAMTVLPEIRFGKIYGDFLCFHNQLTTLKYCPKEVNGSFSCIGNKLTSLEYCPNIVSNNFACSNNPLTSLKYCPKEVNMFLCTDTNLTSLEFCPSLVKDDFCCGNLNYDYQLLVNTDNRPYSQGKLTSIEDYPLCIIKRGITEINYFPQILKIVKENEEIFRHLLDNKIKFHQMVMCLDPSLIKYYKTISQPNKNSTLLI